MIRLLASVLILIAAGYFAGACAPAPAPVAVVSTPTVAAAAPRAAWEQKWESIVAAAKKEGTVRAYAFWPKETIAALASAFGARYGIDVEFTVLRGTEVSAKVQAEHRAGLNLVDVHGQGATTLITVIKGAGLLGQIEPLLLLPEVLDGNAWRGGKGIVFADKARQVIQMSAIPQRYFIYNSTLVKPGELTSYKDVLHPRFKGKINLYDPTISGTGSSLISHLAYNVWNLEEAKEFLKRLLTEQDVFILRDYRLQVETVARGKYAIGLGAQGSAAAEFVAMGAPIDVPQINEVSLGSEAGNLGVPAVQPHPNAATVFINWLLTKEGQSIFSRTIGAPVMRADVPLEGISPIYRLRPEDKIFLETEDYRYFKDQLYKTTKEIVDAYAK